MTMFEVQDADFETRVRAGFAGQNVMHMFKAEMTKVAPGEVEIQMPFNPELTQQNGFLHAGVVTTILDSACGFAAYSLMPTDAAVLTVEYKVNLVSPAKGDYMIARGRVAKPGRTITVCTGDVFAVADGKEKLVATMLATIMAIRNRADLKN